MPTYTDIPSALTTQKVLQYDESVVIQDLQRLLLTNKGEYMDLPDYGTNIGSFIYEGMNPDTAVFLEMDVRDAVNKWMEDQVEVLSVEVKVDYDTQEIVIDLTVYLLEFNKQAQFSTPLTDTR